MLGFSGRYSSFMVNIDKIFVNGFLDLAFPPGLGINHYRTHRTGGDFILDARTAWQFNKVFRASFIVKNVFNRLYMERPALMTAPRSWVIQLGFSF
jgi:outer membrane receptor protein involved in Fe transport